MNRLLSFMLLLGFRTNFVLVPSKIQEQKVVMHIILKHLCSFINMTATLRENRILYNIKSSSIS